VDQLDFVAGHPRKNNAYSRPNAGAMLLIPSADTSGVPDVLHEGSSTPLSLIGHGKRVTRENFLPEFSADLEKWSEIDLGEVVCRAG
jgi:hypothetical protein